MATIHGAATLDLRATFAATGKVTARSSASLDLLIGFEAIGSAFSIIPAPVSSLALALPPRDGYLLANAAAGDAWVEVDLGAGYDEIWVSWSLFFEADALALWIAGGEVVMAVANLDQIVIDSSGWDSLNAFGNVPPPTAGVRQTLEYGRVVNGATEFYVDGALVFSGVDSSGDPSRFVSTGQVFGTTDPASVSQTRDFKIGTSRGGSDLFHDDFSSGNLDLWTTVTGDVTVVTTAIQLPITPADTASLSLAAPSPGALALAPAAQTSLTLVAA